MSVLHSAMNSSHSFLRSEPALGFFPFHESYSLKRVRSVSPHISASSKKRSYSDTNESSGVSEPVKRSRTAPSSPPSALGGPQLDWSPICIPLSLSQKPARRVVAPTTGPIKLPSLSDALANIPTQPLRTITPTVSQDYFDTYKPNDDNWRYGLLDSIRNSKVSMPLDLRHQNPQRTTLPSISEMDKSVARPHFDSRVGSKSFPAFPQQRKINFPYESNYTYLNKTYMKDVEKFPEYLELARSLMSLSRTGRSATHGSSLANSDSSYRYADLPADYKESRFQSPHTPNYPTFKHEKGEKPEFNKPDYKEYSEYKPGYKEYPEYKDLKEPKEYRESSSPIARSYHAIATPENSFEYTPQSPVSGMSHNKFIPITPPSLKDKSRSELIKTPPKSSGSPRVCISCGSDQSPCWRPSWSIKEGQLCNSCGLRYKKTAARCLNEKCKKIPAKGEWSLMQNEGMAVFEDGTKAYKCLDCGDKVEVSKK